MERASSDHFMAAYLGPHYIDDICQHPVRGTGLDR